ncbi:DUF5590 domain-containing protein [Terribacillus sp. 7520-G]|uniref:cell wall elongation regulator TseB-like domain-containing protein n=1 Tax=Terribacillus TaxID=459532 RepID=UPI000BA74E25|nr:DUF5590 domain-containing protein [Terribacillus sp. 7520-G]PAD39326.1 hypothetical protein CHH53_06090 [Terribacillus sp. 7520-G]
MIRRYSRFTVPKWAKITLFSALAVLLIVLGCGIYVYSTAQHARTDGFEASEKFALENTELENVDEVTRFNGEHVYHVVRGKQSDGTDAIAFIRKGEKDADKIIYTTDSADEEQVESSWKSACGADCDMDDVRLGLYDGSPAWEVTYRDGQDRLGYSYYTLDGTEQLENFALSNQYQ